VLVFNEPTTLLECIGVQRPAYNGESEKAAYDPIEQGVVVINSMPEKTDEAEQFRQFLLSDRAAVVLEKYGYQVNR